MDLLLEIKSMYEKLKELKIIKEMPSYQEIESLAEKVYRKNFKDLDKILIPVLSSANYASIETHIKNIKKIVENDLKD